MSHVQSDCPCLMAHQRLISMSRRLRSKKPIQNITVRNTFTSNQKSHYTNFNQIKLYQQTVQHHPRRDSTNKTTKKKALKIKEKKRNVHVLRHCICFFVGHFSHLDKLWHILSWKLSQLNSKKKKKFCWLFCCTPL